MARPARVSPDRILDAAAREFACRGFAGATVDRIARRARVNKAMLYYHFGSKRALYRALLRRMFTLAGDRLQVIGATPRQPAEKLDAAIAAVAELIRDHASFPAIMLREVADGGAHLDAETLAALSRVPQALAGIIQEGISQGAFRPINPAFAHFSLLVPVVFFLANSAIRNEITDLNLMNMSTATSGDFVRYMQDAARRALTRDVPSERPR
jgi:AcrR family transcriptional regulator